MNSNVYGARPLSRTGTSASDLMWITYRWMSLGLALTGVVALLIAHSETAISLLFSGRSNMMILMFAQLGLVIAFSAVAPRASTAVAAAMFFAYAALTGVTFAAVFLVYTGASIGTTFLVTGGTFGALSAYGAVTKRDLSAIGRFALFAVIGLVIAGLVNIFLASPLLMWIQTFAGVLIFAGLTAYDTQRLRALYAEGAEGNLPLIGALTLYLDFINMFLFLLRIFGRRRD